MPRQADTPGILPGWPAPPRVHAFQSVRASGDIEALRDALNLPSAPCWLKQVHGTAVARPGAGECGAVADAAVTTAPGTVLAIRTADCLPVLLCDRGGTVVGAAHAGWRGMAAGVIEATVAAMAVEPGGIVAWLGPAIGQQAFEVGPEVRAAFVDLDPGAESAFRPGTGDRYHADLVALARRRLRATGITRISGGEWCTATDVARFYSYRRDGETGRMASLVWLG